mmetsp:Transcript_84379/g.188443  ORF Transcript_84379/g.188443 Transcript_84379/m.188443 type:complete len:299 (-) Transcript_84379:464-1360(-)
MASQPLAINLRVRLLALFLSCGLLRLLLLSLLLFLLLGLVCTLVLLACLLGRCTPIELGLLLAGLEAPVTHLGGGVDELQVDLLGGPAAHLRQQRLAQRDDALLWPHDGALQHHPILRDLAIVEEATHGSDSLLSKIGLGHCTVRVILDGFSDSVDLLVDLGPVAIATLTRTRHLEGHASRVPRANARNLAEAAVGLPHEPGDTPSCNHALDAMALGDANDVDHLVLGEDVCNLHLLLEEAHGEVHLLRSGAAVDLDLFDVRLLLTDLHLADLRVANGADHLAILLCPLHLGLHGRTL